jgi:hypothetical protein
VSLTTRKNNAQPQAGAGLDRARQAATRVSPLARSAGTAAAQGVQSAREWAAPRLGKGVEGARGWAAPRIEKGVRGARGWAAPRIEQAARGLQDNVAPRVSEMLEASARKIEPDAESKRRVWPRLLAGLAVITAAAGAVAVVLARRRSAPQPDDAMSQDEAGQDEMAEGAPAEGDDTMMAETGGRDGKGRR